LRLTQSWVDFIRFCENITKEGEITVDLGDHVALDASMATDDLPDVPPDVLRKIQIKQKFDALNEMEQEVAMLFKNSSALKFMAKSDIDLEFINRNMHMVITSNQRNQGSDSPVAFFDSFDSAKEHMDSQPRTLMYYSMWPLSKTTPTDVKVTYIPPLKLYSINNGEASKQSETLSFDDINNHFKAKKK
jgi:hypothetical protein